MIAEFSAEAEAKLNSLNAAIDEKYNLSAPAKYWADRAETHSARATGFGAFFVIAMGAILIVDGGLKVRINGALYTGRQASSVPMAEIPSDSRVRSLRAAS
ncbi:MAG: DUF6161 domain-containing protein, partial [Planctomycetota bacterium]